MSSETEGIGIGISTAHVLVQKLGGYLYFKTSHE